MPFFGFLRFWTGLKSRSGTTGKLIRLFHLRATKANQLTGFEAQTFERVAALTPQGRRALTFNDEAINSQRRRHYAQGRRLYAQRRRHYAQGRRRYAQRRRHTLNAEGVTLNAEGVS